MTHPISLRFQQIRMFGTSFYPTPEEEGRDGFGDLLKYYFL